MFCYSGIDHCKYNGRSSHCASNVIACNTQNGAIYQPSDIDGLADEIYRVGPREERSFIKNIKYLQKL